jgi:hypothetical protein
MHDFLSDWRRWSRIERAAACLLAALGVALPLLAVASPVQTVH